MFYILALLNKFIMITFSGEAAYRKMILELRYESLQRDLTMASIQFYGSEYRAAKLEEQLKEIKDQAVIWHNRALIMSVQEGNPERSRQIAQIEERYAAALALLEGELQKHREIIRAFPQTEAELKMAVHRAYTALEVFKAQQEVAHASREEIDQILLSAGIKPFAVREPAPSEYESTSATAAEPPGKHDNQKIGMSCLIASSPDTPCEIIRLDRTD